MSRLIIAVLGMLAIAFAACAPNSNDRSIEGIWQGNLEFTGIKIRIGFRISREPDGNLSAVMLRPDQDDREIPIDRVALRGERLVLEVASIRGSFEGDLGSDGLTIKGQWSQAGRSTPLILVRVSEISRPHRPQDPVLPYPYDEIEVAYSNDAAQVDIVGRLTLPRLDRRLPAVLLISGGGAQDRDGTILGHRPFLVMADHLTRRGIVVLRVDDRGMGGSTGDRSQATTEDYAQDAAAGLEFLKSRPEIDARCIGMIGHSEGAAIAAMLAARRSDVAFIVMMAGQGLPGEEYNYQFEESMGRSLGLSEEVIASKRAIQEQVFNVLKEQSDTEVARAKLRLMLESLVPPMPATQIDATLNRYLSPWFGFSIAYDPGMTLKMVRCSVLALFAEKDVQVPPEGNMEAVSQALKRGGNPDFTVEVMPDLNHLFQTAETGSPSEYGRIEETVSPRVLRMITDWILQRVSGLES